MKKSRNFYLTVDNQEEQEICLLCEEVCQVTDDVQVFTKVYWEKLKPLLKSGLLDISKRNETNFIFKSVYSNIHDKEASYP